MAHVFISYSHQDDTDFFLKLKQEIENEEIEYWTDEKISPGELWSKAIDDAIKNAFVVVVVMSPVATESQYITYEWSFAMGLGKIIIPLVVTRGTKLHPKLSELQHIDFTNKNPENWERLMTKLRVLKDLPVALSASPQTDKSQTILGSFKSKNSAQRANAIRVAVDLGNKDLVPELISILENTAEKSPVRQVAAEGLGTLKAEEAIPSLLFTLLNTTTRGVNLHASIIWALGELHAKSAVSTLVEYFRMQKGVDSAANSDKLLKAVVEALTQIGTPEALAAVKEWKRQQETLPPTT